MIPILILECNHVQPISPRIRIESPTCDGLRRLNMEVILLHPKSKGYLKLFNANPFLHPLIHPYGLSDEEHHDVETLVAGILEAIKFAESPALHELGLKLEHNIIPDCESEHLDEHYWRCAVRWVFSYFLLYQKYYVLMYILCCLFYRTILSSQ